MSSQYKGETDMTTINAIACTTQVRSPRLVSVDGRTYPLKAASINARAEGGVAVTTLTQNYDNPHTEALEVLYTLPLPADGAVAGYTIRIGQRVIRGEIRRREEAKEEYHKALIEGRMAALLEQEREDTFSQNLGNVPAGEKVAVEIEVLHPLAFLPGTKNEMPCWEYRFPTVVGVRYQGEDGRVPDAGKLDVDRASEEIAVTLEASIQIADGPAEQTRPHSPSQRIKVQEDEHGATVTLENGMHLDRDLVVRWAAGKREAGVRAVEGKGLACDDGRYLLITLTPPTAASRAIPRDLTLLIDASGSMSGEPLEQAKAVAGELLRSLDPDDRFEILTFANQVRRLTRGPVDALEKNINHALDELRHVQAGGATEMKEALIEALKPLRHGAQRQVILLSDGQIGFEKEVIGEIWRSPVPGARVHVVGVGSAPNRALTRGAARAGRGIELIIGLEEDAANAANRLLQATVHPVLTDVTIEGSGILSAAPQKPPDVFAGKPSLIFAKVKPEGGSVQLRGRLAGSGSPWIHNMDIPHTKHASAGQYISAASIPIGALFGRESIEDAEIDLAASVENNSKAIERKIESLGLRHGIPSRMTSLVAISEDTTVDPKDPRRRERLPVEVPAGVSAEGVGLVRGAEMKFLTFGVARELVSYQDIIKASRVGRYEKSRFANILTPKRSIIGPMLLGPIMIDNARVLRIDDQILVFEFEVPVDGFMLPGKHETIYVEFEDCGHSPAGLLDRESTNRGPHQAGLTVRLALKLEPPRCWRHEAATIHWHGRVRREHEEVETDVTIRVHLGRRN
jgi:Ca-activated chloride channel family protein